MFIFSTKIKYVAANGTATVARLHIDGSYRLNGYKWFTSATDSDMAFTLARIIDEKSV